jgi:hypothetical protein
MCTESGAAPGSVAEALRMAHASMDYLNGRGGAGLEAGACGDVLRSLGEVQAKTAAAHASALSRFDAASAHDAEGYGTSRSWLGAMAKMRRKDAAAAVRLMRALRRHRPLAEALAAGQITVSWAEQILDWIAKLPASCATTPKRSRTSWKSWSGRPPPARRWRTWRPSSSGPGRCGRRSIPTPMTGTGSTSGTCTSPRRLTAPGCCAVT